MNKDIRIKSQKPLLRQIKGAQKTGVQAKLQKGLQHLGKEIVTKKTPGPKIQVSKKETSNTKTIPVEPPAHPEQKNKKPEPRLPKAGQTWVEKKASGKDGKKRRCLVALVFSGGGITYTLTVSQVAYDMGDMCPTFIQELGAFLKTWECMK